MFAVSNSGQAAGSLAAAARKLFGDDAGLACELASLRPRALRKLPELVNAGGLYTNRALQQSTSETVARFKATLVSGGHLLVLCGGLGVDDIYLSRSFDRVTSIDLDRKLNEIARTNYSAMGLQHITRLDEDAVEYAEKLKGDSGIGLAYLDPDRRPEDDGRRAVDPRQMLPDPVMLSRLLLEKGIPVMLKMPPFADIQFLLKHFPHTAFLHVISSDDEVKELLLLLKPGYSGETQICAHELHADSAPDSYCKIIGSPSEIRLADEDQWIFIPSPALIKSGLWEAFAGEHDFAGDSAGLPILYAAGRKQLPAGFGKWYELQGSFCSLKDALRQMKASGIPGASLSIRGFAGNAEDVAKQNKIAPSADYRLWMLRYRGKTRVLLGKRDIRN